ncbi:DUF4189 domain-containing protein [Lysobacter terrestris]|uniref:DUF4189 domain-containing protein n=1 Tax=Agrilutibacter terrestris TaxID=2865112 RepID=A0A7H0FXV4_9GAMM|nr:DUF4189 domain-containing protein [Lysobacter terrestris]
MLLMLLAFAGAALAEQGCASGFYPGGAQPGGQICVPIPGYGTTNNTGAEGSSVWANRWGAIAIGNGVAGVSEGLPSRGKAKRTALDDCKAGGGMDCKVIVAYVNQCVALATGSGDSSYGRAPSCRSSVSSCSGRVLVALYGRVPGNLLCMQHV